MEIVDSDATLADVFVMLADTLREGYDIVDTMDLLVQAVTRFTSASEAGILLADDRGVLHVVASSSERAAEVEEAQLGAAAGPCLESIRLGESVEVPDIEEEQVLWPDFASVAKARGFLAAHATPLRIRSHVLGGLNLFSATRGPLSDYDVALSEALAQIATISVVQHQKEVNSDILTNQLQHALDSRVIIEQAKGVLAQRRGSSVQDAFTVLRNYARRTNMGLRTVAEQIVNGTLTIR